jgi:hypothetical protein
MVVADTPSVMNEILFECYSALEEQIVQHAFHDVPVTDNTGTGVKTIAQLSPRGSPRFAIPPVMSRYRDRKLNRQCQFIGYDAYVDATTRGQLRYRLMTGGMANRGVLSKDQPALTRWEPAHKPHLLGAQPPVSVYRIRCLRRCNHEGTAAQWF